MRFIRRFFRFFFPQKRKLILSYGNFYQRPATYRICRAAP